MVEVNALAQLLKLFAQCLTTLTRWHVDDARALDIVYDAEQLVYLIVDIADDIRQIGAGKARA